jgi:quinol monooxygenase YgiN
MVRLRVALHPAPTQTANDLLEALRFLVVGTRSEPGCLSSSAWVEYDTKVYYVEEWATEAEMRRRVRSDQFTKLLAVVESSRDPFVQFDFVAKTRGLDYAVEVRNARRGD